MQENDILELIHKDSWMMEILIRVQSLNLLDWWIGAGFVRSKVWDHLHGYKTRTKLPDIDVIYFDHNDFEKEEEHAFSTKKELFYESQLEFLNPEINWSVTNQARMHHLHRDQPYIDATDSLSRWVETATCVGVRIENNNELVLAAPHGIEDLVNLIVRPNPVHKGSPDEFRKRIEEKEWLTKWPKLKVVL